MDRTDYNQEKENLLNWWFEVKLRLHYLRRRVHFKDGEVWWCSFGENIGVEINGKHKRFERPVLIVCKLSGESFIGVPLTSQQHDGNWYVGFEFQEKENYAVLAQIRTLSSRRLQRRMGELTSGDFHKVIDGLDRLIIAKYRKNNHPRSDD